jgi:hypothetical protein
VSAACFMVCQSDWLPMMIATGFPAIGPLGPKEARDYRGGPWGDKAAGKNANFGLPCRFAPQK